MRRTGEKNATQGEEQNKEQRVGVVSYVLHAYAQQIQSIEQLVAAQFPEGTFFLKWDDLLQFSKPWGFGVASLSDQLTLQDECTQIGRSPAQGIIPVERNSRDVSEGYADSHRSRITSVTNPLV